MVTVSVIIPNYNHAPFLQQRIESVLNQTYRDFELIILDDCSTDKSKGIIESYKYHSKVTEIIYNDFNSASTFSQWQKGIGQAKGKWIWIAESDDLADFKLLEKLMDVIQKNNDCVLAFCATQHMDKDGKSLGLNTWADELDIKKWKLPYENKGLDEIGNYLIYRNTLPNASAVIFKREYAGKIAEIVNRKMRFTGDWLFWMEVMKNQSICYTPLVLNFQRSHSTTTRNWAGISFEIQRIKEYLLTIKRAAEITQTSVHWANKNYDWVFFQCRQNVPFNFKTIFILFTKTRSLTFLIRIMREYKIFSFR